jgi:hypothetical protein
MFFSFYKIQRPGFYLQLLIFFPLEIVMVYINFYVLMPRLLFAGKFWQYGGVLAGGIIILAVVNTLYQVMYAKMGYMEFAVTANFDFATIRGARNGSVLPDRVYHGHQTGAKLDVAPSMDKG